jgi:hypothetical protein
MILQITTRGSHFSVRSASNADIRENRVPFQLSGKGTLYLSRARYSWLVVNYPDAMAWGVWQHLTRRWHLGGVHVSGAPEEIREVCEMLGRPDLIPEES